MVGSGCGSFFGRGRFDGFPSKILSFVGFFGGPDTKITSYPICASIFSYINLSHPPCPNLRNLARRPAPLVKRRSRRDLHPPTLSMHSIMTRLAQALQVLRVEGVATISDLDLVMNQCRSCYYTSSKTRLAQRMSLTVLPADRLPSRRPIDFMLPWSPVVVISSLTSLALLLPEIFPRLPWQHATLHAGYL